jgi:hypothetical protein
VYKTGLCDHFDEDNPNSWRCVWKRRCAHSHGRDDVRTKEEATEGWKQHLMTALPLTSNTQLPTMLNRLLAAGGQAFDNIVNNSAKRSSGTSPSSIHRRSLSGTSGLQPQPLQPGLGPMRVGSMNQGPSGRPMSHLSFGGAPMHIGSPHSFAQPLDVSPHSQPSTPMHARVPMLLTGVGSGHSPKDSPRSLLSSTTALRASPTEVRTPLGLTSGLGFFSGADSNLWAPSPKTSQMTPSSGGGVQPQSTTGRQVERFSFEQHPHTNVHDSAAAAWADAPRAEKTAHPMSTSSYLSPLHNSSLLIPHGNVSNNPLLHTEDIKLLSPPVDPSQLEVSPAPLLHTSPSPDSVPTTVAAKALWSSPPTVDINHTANGMTLVQEKEVTVPFSFQQQLTSHLQCSLPIPPNASHLFSSPVVTSCCGLALCKQCVEPYLIAQSQPVAQSKSPSLSSDEVEQKKQESSSSIVCRCGRRMDAQRLRDAPIVSSLQSLRDWAKQIGEISLPNPPSENSEVPSTDSKSAPVQPITGTAQSTEDN